MTSVTPPVKPPSPPAWSSTPPVHLKSDYRRFNLSPESAGDDYAAMSEALRRRYTRVKKGEVPMPDVLFVDGGKGQLAEAMKVLAELELDWLRVVAVAKGRAQQGLAPSSCSNRVRETADDPSRRIHRHCC